MEKKVCKSCKEIKTIDNFYRYKKKYYKGDCKYCTSINAKSYNQKNKENNLSRNKKWRQNNLEKVKQSRKKYYEKNKVLINSTKKSNEWILNKRKTDPIFKLKSNISSSLRRYLKIKGFRKNSTTSKILGCSKEIFLLHIESKFESWMTWENYGLYNGHNNYGWDLDHIIPLSSANTEDEVISLNHYSNFQPLCSFVNRSLKRGLVNWDPSNK